MLEQRMSNADRTYPVLQCSSALSKQSRLIDVQCGVRGRFGKEDSDYQGGSIGAHSDVGLQYAATWVVRMQKKTKREGAFIRQAYMFKQRNVGFHDQVQNSLAQGRRVGVFL